MDLVAGLWLALAVGVAGADAPGTAGAADLLAHSEGRALVRGAPDASPLALAQASGGLGDSAGLGWFGTPAARGASRQQGLGGWLEAGSSAGSFTPEYIDGYPEDGVVSGWIAGTGLARWGPLHAVAEPQLSEDIGGPRDGGRVALRQGFVAVAGEAGALGLVSMSAGWKRRWMGPGAFGSLLLTNNAVPAPTVDLSWERSLWPGSLARVEAGAGRLDGERRDVRNPGWLFMDFRLVPVHWAEVGLGRVGIFGGEGRPSPPFGQLILPTKPHVDDDPDQLLPDQDEAAALDLWLATPRALGPLRRGALWWQYGGEDLIVRRDSGLPIPALAGVANLVGGELVLGNIALRGEYARIFDDTFRWYTGHRVYHQGLVRDGRWMAHAAGGDAISTRGELRFSEGPRTWGLGATHDRRIGVVEAANDHVFALATDAVDLRIGARLCWQADTGTWAVETDLGRTSGADFVPGRQERSWRVGLSRRGRPHARVWP